MVLRIDFKARTGAGTAIALWETEEARPAMPIIKISGQGLMAIAFPYPLSGCAFAAFFPLERALAGLRRRFRSPPLASAPDPTPPART